LCIFRKAVKGQLKEKVVLRLLMGAHGRARRKARRTRER